MTKVHVDSDASRHFLSANRLSAWWQEVVPSNTFNTAAGITITSKAVGTFKCLAADVHDVVRVAASCQPTTQAYICEPTNQTMCVQLGIAFLH